MKNMKFHIEDEKLHIEIDLTQSAGPGKKEKNMLVASSGGFVPLLQNGGYRLEKLNLIMYRPFTEDELKELKGGPMDY